MPLYEIAVRYYTNKTKETSAQYKPQLAEKTQARTEEIKEKSEGRSFTIPHKAVTLALGGAAKVNQYVGELTENTVSQKRASVALTYVGFGILALSNPILAIGGAALYTANTVAQFEIRRYKENLTANYLKDLSGGTVKTGR
ncbi:MAG: hypothetical protein M0R51_13215 [Clostridia bacterium]|jgi:hypothetical protein|nr:hypothetical protein [Clostridia bacterium]